MTRPLLLEEGIVSLAQTACFALICRLKPRWALPFIGQIIPYRIKIAEASLRL